MKRSQTILGFAAGVLVLAVLYFGIYPALFPRSIAAQLRAGGVSTPLNAFTLKSVDMRKASSVSVTNVDAESSGTQLHLEITQGMEEKLAELYLEEEKVGIESLFVAQPAHYPGVITREVDCSAEFQPEKGTVGDTAYYIMYANERFSYGICAQDLAKYRSVVGLLYCKNRKTFVETKLFFPIETFDKDQALGLLKSFQCI